MYCARVKLAQIMEATHRMSMNQYVGVDGQVPFVDVVHAALTIVAVVFSLVFRVGADRFAPAAFVDVVHVAVAVVVRFLVLFALLVAEFALVEMGRVVCVLAVAELVIELAVAFGEKVNGHEVIQDESICAQQLEIGVVASQALKKRRVHLGI